MKYDATVAIVPTPAGSMAPLYSNVLLWFTAANGRRFICTGANLIAQAEHDERVAEAMPELIELCAIRCAVMAHRDAATIRRRLGP
ncbi:MAG: hypothetical protein LC708_00935 [Actinobacteria bacterium]|nr:hypothetical protein [Actinomycetota bacterium]